MSPKFTPFMHYKNILGHEWNNQWADLIIFFDFAYFELNSEIINQIKLGDTIDFKAKIDRLRNFRTDEIVNE